MIHHHKVAKLGLKKNEIETLTNELKKQAKNHGLETEGYEQRNNCLYFVLVGKMDDIESFLEYFNNNYKKEEWHIDEMGVSEFARVMRLSDEEAKEWYELIDKHHLEVMRQAHAGDQLFKKIMKINTIDELKYVQSHVVGELTGYIDNRIKTLQGKESDYEENMRKFIEKEKMKEHFEKLLTSQETITLSKEMIIKILWIID